MLSHICVQSGIVFLVLLTCIFWIALWLLFECLIVYLYKDPKKTGQSVIFNDVLFYQVEKHVTCYIPSHRYEKD